MASIRCIACQGETDGSFPICWNCVVAERRMQMDFYVKLFTFSDARGSGEDDLVRMITESMLGIQPVSKGLPNDLTNQLPIYYCCKKDTQEVCGVCLEPWKVKNKAIKLPCQHFYHKACITEWFKTATTCPTCRHDCATTKPPANK